MFKKPKTKKNSPNAEKNKMYTTPEEILNLSVSKLSTYEREEILHYPEVYFIGGNAKKRSRGRYDNNQGYYIFVLYDHLAYRYETLRIIGQGTFGQVVEAYDHKNRQIVAIKIARNEKQTTRQTHLEIEMLQHLQEKSPHRTRNIVKMLESFMFRDHVHIVFELMYMDLFDYMHRKNRGFCLSMVRKISLAVVQCLDGLFKNQIIHGDIKPENIVLKDSNLSDIRVIDFGASCFDGHVAFAYIQSRFYRAPEVILGLPLGMSIDMWSLGCTLAELATGMPLFPGHSELDQLACIIELLGMPPKSFLAGCTRVRRYFNEDGTRLLSANKNMRVHNRGPPGSRSLRRALNNCTDYLFLDFITSCLVWDPKTRLTPSEALHHGWVYQSNSLSASFRNISCFDSKHE